MSKKKKGKKILIMGLPGAGKTFLAKKIYKSLKAIWINADIVRRRYKDWDFSEGGRIRQAYRMNSLASKDSFSISSFICPTEEHRRIFDPEIIIWMDINKESEYKDTDNIFEPPEHYDIRITKWITEDQLSNCLEGINHGTMDIHNYLNELIKRLAKLQ